jgi:hypothetical protein
MAQRVVFDCDRCGRQARCKKIEIPIERRICGVPPPRVITAALDLCHECCRHALQTLANEMDPNVGKGIISVYREHPKTTKVKES